MIDLPQHLPVAIPRGFVRRRRLFFQRVFVCMVTIIVAISGKRIILIGNGVRNDRTCRISLMGHI
jgi:hypothetical protein